MIDKNFKKIPTFKSLLELSIPQYGTRVGTKHHKYTLSVYELFHCIFTQCTYDHQGCVRDSSSDRGRIVRIDVTKIGRSVSEARAGLSSLLLYRGKAAAVKVPAAAAGSRTALIWRRLCRSRLARLALYVYRELFVTKRIT